MSISILVQQTCRDIRRYTYMRQVLCTKTYALAFNKHEPLCGNMQAKLITPRTKNFYIRHKFKQNIYNKVRYTLK